MSVIPKLAASLGRRDELPNQEVAKQIAEANDRNAVDELVQNLSYRDKNIQSDCIKTLYEIGALKPALVADHSEAFVKLLDHKNNRMVWGAMTALDEIATVDPKFVYKHLTKILAAAERGSVIAKDHAVNILVKLAAHTLYRADALPLLFEQLKTAATNQLPMYAESALSVMDATVRNQFQKILTTRLLDIEKESKRKRVEKVLRKLAKQTS